MKFNKSSKYKAVRVPPQGQQGPSKGCHDHRHKLRKPAKRRA